jgi:hypothetical protein
MTRKTCAYPGCTSKHSARGLCHRHYQAREHLERLEIELEDSEPDPIWEWYFLSEIGNRTTHHHRLLLAKDPKRRVFEMIAGSPWPLEISGSHCIAHLPGQCLLHYTEAVLCGLPARKDRDPTLRDGWWHCSPGQLIEVARHAARERGLLMLPLRAIPEMDMRMKEVKKFMAVVKYLKARA